MITRSKKELREKKRYSIRKKISGTGECPRLAIYRSNRIIIPKDDDSILHSDEILVLTKQEYIKETEELFL